MRYTGSSKAITISARTSGPAWRIQRSVAVNRPTGLRCSPIPPLFLWPCWRTLAQLISDPLARREQPVRNIKIPFVRSLEVALFIAQASVLRWVHRGIGPYSHSVHCGIAVGRQQSLWIFHLVGSGYGYLVFAFVWWCFCIDWIRGLSSAEIPAASRYG